MRFTNQESEQICHDINRIANAFDIIAASLKAQTEFDNTRVQHEINCHLVDLDIKKLQLEQLQGSSPEVALT